MYERGGLFSEFRALEDRFYRVIYTGRHVFLRTKKISFIPSNYNALMDSGSRSAKYIQEEEYILYANDSVKIKASSKRKIVKYMKLENDQLKNYIKEKDLSNDERDITSMLLFMDQ
jgi:hypothetical protein